MVKGKASSTKPPDYDVSFSKNKSSYVYIVTNKTKVKISLRKRYLIEQRDLMHPVSMLEPKKIVEQNIAKSKLWIGNQKLQELQN